MKKNTVEKEKSPPEKFWQVLVDVYFQFYKTHFRDSDGFMLQPDWSSVKRGMESKGLKGILVRLRTIEEEKGNEWTEDFAKVKLLSFLTKAYNIPFLKRSFMCCLLNKYKDQVIVTENNSELVKKILEYWYYEFKDYTRDFENDRAASERIILFLKEQYKTSGAIFSENSVLATMRVIMNQIKAEEFWLTKSLKSISYNLQEIINKIKSKHGTNKTPTPESLAAEFNRRYKK